MRRMRCGRLCTRDENRRVRSSKFRWPRQSSFLIGRGNAGIVLDPPRLARARPVRDGLRDRTGKQLRGDFGSRSPRPPAGCRGNARALARAFRARILFQQNTPEGKRKTEGGRLPIARIKFLGNFDLTHVQRLIGDAAQGRVIVPRCTNPARAVSRLD